MSERMDGPKVLMDFCAGCLRCSWRGVGQATVEAAKLDAERHSLHAHMNAASPAWRDVKPS